MRTSWRSTSIGICRARSSPWRRWRPRTPWKAGDYARFYDRAVRVKDLAGVDISLRGRDGQQLANTRVPWGTPLPRNPYPERRKSRHDRETLCQQRRRGSGRRPSHLHHQRSDQRERRGCLLSSYDHRLGATRRPAPLRDRPRTDRRDIGSRQCGHDAHARNPVSGSASPRRKASSTRSKANKALGSGQNIQGYEIRLGYARSKLSGWIVWVGVPDADIQNPLHRALWRLSALGVALTIIALGLAYWLGGRLAGASRTLAAQAAALGRGDAVSPANIPVREFDEVGHELVAAGARRKGLEQRLVRTATQESEQRFQTLVHGVTDYAIYMLDPQGHVTNWNTGAMRIKGYSESEILGRHFSIFYTPEDRADGVPARALADGDQRRPLRSGGLAGAQGRHAFLGQRRHRSHRGFQRQAASAWPRSPATSPSGAKPSSAWRRRASSSINRKRWTRSASSPAAWRTTSTIF